MHFIYSLHPPNKDVSNTTKGELSGQPVNFILSRINLSILKYFNMKSTWPMQIHLAHIQQELCSLGLLWGSRYVCNNLRKFTKLFGYQHVGMGNTNPLCWGPYPMQSPNANVFLWSNGIWALDEKRLSHNSP